MWCACVPGTPFENGIEHNDVYLHDLLKGAKLQSPGDEHNSVLVHASRSLQYSLTAPAGPGPVDDETTTAFPTDGQEVALRQCVSDCLLGLLTSCGAISKMTYLQSVDVRSIL